MVRRMMDMVNLPQPAFSRRPLSGNFYFILKIIAILIAYHDGKEQPTQAPPDWLEASAASMNFTPSAPSTTVG